MDTVLKPLSVMCSGVFLDLGISSPQFDDESRGFRPEQDGPLDLGSTSLRAYPRLSFSRGWTATSWSDFARIRRDRGPGRGEEDRRRGVPRRGGG